MMKHIWILLIAILAMSAIAAIADEPSECAALKTAFDNASAALSAAEDELDNAEDNLTLVLASSFLDGIAEGLDDFGHSADKGLGSGSNPADRLRRQHAQTQARLRKSRAQRALDAAQAAYNTAQGNYEMCVASHIARWVTGPSCGHRYIHAFESRHNLPFIFDCGHSSYLCKSSEHQQVTCTSETFWHTGSIRVTIGCRATYWKCKDASSHRRIWYRGSPYKRCGLPSHLSEDNSNGGTSGTTTSPTIQNNGGNTGGTTGGTSADRVRCGHSNCQRGGWASSREAHKTTCPAGHSYYACSLNGASFHANCRAQRSGQVRCARGSLCRSGGWASSRNAHRTTCSAGHTYWSCWPSSVSRHRRCR